MSDHRIDVDPPELQCEVCKQELAVGVASVPGIPYSAAYGRTCLQKQADPYTIVRANVACCGGPEHVADWVLEGMTYLDGEYMTMKAALTKYPMTKEETDLDDYNAGRAFNEDAQWFCSNCKYALKKQEVEFDKPCPSCHKILGTDVDIYCEHGSAPDVHCDECGRTGVTR